MCTLFLDNTIVDQAFDGLKVNQLTKTEKLEILSISMGRNAIFSKHESPTDAHLIVLEGKIVFHIEDHPVKLHKHQHLCFERETEHWVEALEDSKFLIIR